MSFPPGTCFCYALAENDSVALQAQSPDALRRGGTRRHENTFYRAPSPTRRRGLGTGGGARRTMPMTASRTSQPLGGCAASLSLVSYIYSPGLIVLSSQLQVLQSQVCLVASLVADRYLSFLYLVSVARRAARSGQSVRSVSGLSVDQWHLGPLLSLAQTLRQQIQVVTKCPVP